MMLIRAKSFFTYSLEIVLAACIALFFFVVLFFMMNRFFPIGPGLDVLIGGENKQGGAAFNLSRSLWVSSGGSDSGLTPRGGNSVASLSSLKNDVRLKKADAIAWQAAYKSQQLYDRDSVQTFNRSSALITFDEHNEMELGPNSLVIIKRMESDLIWPDKRTFMVVVDGELRGKVKAGGKAPLYLEIETPNAVANVQSVLGGQGIDFKISVDSESSSSITVYEGLATITGAGTSIEINQNETTVVLGDSVPAAPERLPDMIRLQAPSENKQFIYRDLPPKVTFSWLEDEAAFEYRLEIATDESFNQLIYQDLLKETSFTHGNLKQGHYYWRVVGLNKNGGEGLPSEAMRVQLKQDLDPPALSYDVPSVSSLKDKYVIKGQVEQGASVFVDGKRTDVDESGHFSYPVDIKPGVNIIVIEAIDGAGNVTYKSETIHGK